MYPVLVVAEILICTDASPDVSLNEWDFDLIVSIESVSWSCVLESTSLDRHKKNSEASATLLGGARNCVQAQIALSRSRHKKVCRPVTIEMLRIHYNDLGYVQVLKSQPSKNNGTSSTARGKSWRANSVT